MPFAIPQSIGFLNRFRRQEDPLKGVHVSQFKLYELTLWFQLEDMFQLIVTPQGIEKVTIQLKDTPTKKYAIGAMLILLRVTLEVLQN